MERLNGITLGILLACSMPVISMRGVRSTNITELGDPAVGVHLDGIYSPRMQGALALMYDVDRIEALRGPQGTLFGRNSTVGSINVISAKPEFGELFGSVSGELGRFNARSIEGFINIPVNSEFAIRVAGKGLKRDSYLEGYWDPNHTVFQQCINDSGNNVDLVNCEKLSGRST